MDQELKRACQEVRAARSLTGTDNCGQVIENPYDDGYWWCDKGEYRRPSSLAVIWPGGGDQADFDEGWLARDREP